MMLTSRRVVFVFASLGLTVVGSAPARAISTSSQDTFAVTNGGWSIGGAGTQPTQVSGAGADGQSGYLTHFSDGSGSNGKWLMWNDQPQWLGNYTSAGVTGISLWANVTTGSAPASMRIAFGGPGGWFASAPQSVSAGWSPCAFDLTAGNFFYVTGSGGSGTFADTLAGVTRFEVLAGTGGIGYRSGGNLVEAGVSTNTIQIDTITAVPEPAGIGLAAVAVAVVVWRASPRVRRSWSGR
jgi:hypothetical protein